MLCIFHLPPLTSKWYQVGTYYFLPFDVVVVEVLFFKKVKKNEY